MSSPKATEKQMMHKRIYFEFYSRFKEKFGVRFVILFRRLKDNIKKLAVNDKNRFWNRQLINYKLFHKPICIKNKKLLTDFPIDCNQFNIIIQKKYCYNLKNEERRLKKEIFFLKNLFINNFDEMSSIIAFYHLNNFKRFLDFKNFKILRQRGRFVLGSFNKTGIGLVNNVLVNRMSNYQIDPNLNHNVDNVNMMGLVNLSNIIIPTDVENYLIKGPKHTPNINSKYNDKNSFYMETDLEIFIRKLIDTELKTNNNDLSKLNIKQKFDIIKIEQEIVNLTKHDRTINGKNTDLEIIKKTINFLKTNNLCISKADKAEIMVMMNLSQFDDFMISALKENNFILCEKNDNKTKERKLQNYIRNLKTKKIINEQEYKFLMPSGSLTPNIFNTVKIHKNPTTLRLIVNASEAFNAHMNSWLNCKLSKYADSTYHLKNSLDLMDRLNKLKIDKNSFMFTLDIKNMFSNINVPEVIEQILHCNKFAKNKALVIPLPQLEEILYLCAESACAQYDSKLYKQTNGIAMGNGLASLFAKFAVNITLNKLLTTDSHGLLGIYCFVDDILCIGRDRSTLTKILNSLKLIDTKFEFTDAVEVDNKIDFLDLKIIRHNNQFDFTIYRKNIKNDLKINFNSKHKYTTKINILTNEIEKAYKICSTELLLKNELNFIKRVYISNSYPEKLINDTIKQINQKFTLNYGIYKQKLNVTKNVDFNKKFETVIIKNDKINNYCNKKVIELKNNSSWIGIDNLFIPKTKPRNSLDILKMVNKPKSIDNDVNKAIYLLECEGQGCKSKYVGQSKRVVTDRVKEHLGRDRLTSTVGIHNQIPGHTFGEKTKTIKIIGKEENLQRRLVHEAFAIRHINPDLNNYIGSTSLLTENVLTDKIN